MEMTEHDRMCARIEELEAELAVSIERDKLWQQAEAKVAELERERDRHRDDAGMYFRQAETADRQLGEARMRVEDERANRVEIAGREADAIQRIAALTSQLAAAREAMDEAEQHLGVFALMATAWDGLPAETVVAEVGVQSIRVSGFRDAREFFFGQLRAALAAMEKETP